MVQWGILCASKARDMGLMPGWGTRIPHAVQLRLHVSHSKKKKKKKIGELSSGFTL